MDAEGQRLIGLLHPRLRDPFARFIDKTKELTEKEIKITSTYRSFEDQENLYARGRTTSGIIVTWAEPGLSWHNYGLAGDICWNYVADPYLEWLFRRDRPKALKLWNTLGECAEEEGFSWGGRWHDERTDRPHVQMTFGMSIREARKIYLRNRSLEEVWKEIDNKAKSR